MQAPACPIILIDGQYLITGASAGGYANAIKLINQTIRRLLQAEAG